MSARDWIAKRREIEQLATGGPWRVAGEGSEGSRVAPDYGDIRTRSRWLLICNGRVQPEDGRNAAFLADARTSLPLALDALDAVLRIALYGAHDVGCANYVRLEPCDCWKAQTVRAIESALGAKSQQITAVDAPSEAEARPEPEVPDLMAALKASVEKAKARRLNGGTDR